MNANATKSASLGVSHILIVRLRPELSAESIRQVGRSLNMDQAKTYRLAAPSSN